MCVKEHACRVAVRVLSTKLTFIASAPRRLAASTTAVTRHTRQQSAAVRGRQHRRQDGQRAAAGARAARLGEDSRPPAEAPLGPALHPATARAARRRCQARRHIPQGSRYPEQTHAGEVPEAER